MKKIHKYQEPSKEQIKDMLRLPEGPEGDEKLKKMLTCFDDSFTQREKLFILFYTSPMSKACGRVNRAASLFNASFKSWGSWAYNQPHIRNKINEILDDISLHQIEDIFRDDIKYCQEVLNCDRTSFKFDNTIELEDKNVSFDVIEDKKIKELSRAQRKMVSGFDYDKNGHAHYTIETRASARQALLTYHKLLSQKQTGNEDKRTETTVTLEAIKDKVIAKVKVIQKNDAEAEAAGEFIETMSDLDEEA